MVEQSDSLTNTEPNVDEASTDRSPCPLCGRKFLTERLDKHMEICSKLKEKKRKQFDSIKQRAENLDKINNYPTEIAIVATGKDTTSTTTVGAKKIETTKKSIDGSKSTTTKTNNTKGSTTSTIGSDVKEKAKPIPNWKRQHEEFIRTIRAARGEVVENDHTNSIEEEDEDGSGRTRTLPPGMVECPTCMRRFSERAAERHINWCAGRQKNEMKQKNSDPEAMERMKARTKIGTLKRPPTNQSDTSTIRSNSTSSHKSISSSESATNNINRKYTRNISKSTESLPTNSRTTTTTNKVQSRNNSRAKMNNNRKSTSTGGSDGNSSRNSTRTDNGNHSRMQQQRDTPNNNNVNSQRPMVRRSGTRNNQATAKINTGLNGSTSTTKLPPKAPIMKFKEKFPHHQQRVNSRQFDSEVLRRNSSAYDDSPKTVPGVRTGGISPIKNQNGFDKRSEMNLTTIGCDIKKRIDMELGGLYDNDLLMNQYDTIGYNRYVDGYLVTKVKDGIIERKRSHSVNSDEARGSTSDSTDSGLGVYGLQQLQPQQQQQQQQLQQDQSMSQQQRKNGSNNSNYPVADVMSPPMSELERRSRLLLRNGSLNDIHLMEPEVMLADHRHHSNMDDDEPLSQYFDEMGEKLSSTTIDLTPRFCHNCGTKYPNTLAKFCYECGNRRFATSAVS
ncbi:Zinc finger C2HC domain-containing protein 1C [Blomia tropicalis]|nr:Zinc finger C2HC domain-containing protein 1C [Blomia tropicalis]